MSLSKPSLEKVEKIEQEYEKYDFDNQWDNCDYTDPISLSEKVGSNDLLIIQWNTRGLRGKIHDIEELLNNTLEQKVGIVMINESWLTKNGPPLPKISGYIYVGKPREDRRGGGVGFLLREDIIFRRKESIEIPNAKCFENIVIEVKGKTNLLICSGYRPPNTDLIEFQEAYDRLLTNMKKTKNVESIIGLDHNLDFIKQDIHLPTANFIENNLEHNMLLTITRPTRVSNTSATLIDNILISNKLHVNFKSGVLTNDFSDHMPCYLILPDATAHKPVMRKVYYRNLTNKVQKKIVTKLSAIDWEVELPTNSVEQAYRKFHMLVTKTIDNYAPTLTKIIKPNKQPCAPWISTGILNSIN